jgi:uncharacterized protein (DUF1330 family)
MPKQSDTIAAPAYFVAEVEIHDPDNFMAYANQFESTIAPFGGQVVSFGAAILPIEGIEATTARAAIVRFPSEQACADWFASAEYQKIAPVRRKSAHTRAFSVAGLPSAKD